MLKIIKNDILCTITHTEANVWCSTVSVIQEDKYKSTLKHTR